MAQVWLITGSSTGFGRAIALAALGRGEQVALTARNPAALADIVARFPDNALALPLDVTSPEQISAAVDEAQVHFGRIDVLVNNAGYGLMGALEEYDDAQMLRCIETNFIGPLRVTRAVLPGMRAQGSGHIVNISAIAAFSNHVGFTAYGGAKAALDAASDALAQELAPLGIKVTVISPGPYRTDFIGRSLEPAARHLAEYDKTSGKFAAYLEKINGKQPGDPDKAAAMIMEMVDSGKAPSRVFLGAYALTTAQKKIASIGKELAEWDEVSRATDF